DIRLAEVDFRTAKNCGNFSAFKILAAHLGLSATENARAAHVGIARIEFLACLEGFRFPLVQQRLSTFAERLYYQQHADRDDKDGPERFDPHALVTQFLKLQSNSSQY